MLGFRFACLALLATQLVGCDRSESNDLLLPAVEDLSQRHACADLIVVAADDEASEGLFLTIDDGLVDQMIESGEPVRESYQVGDERIELRWVTGSNVYAGHCGLDNGDPWQVDMVQQAIAGEISIELSPGSEGPILAVELRDVLLSPLALAQTAGPDCDKAQPLPPMMFEGLRVDR